MENIYCIQLIHSNRIKYVLTLSLTPGWGKVSLALKSRTVLQQKLQEQTPDPLAAAVKAKKGTYTP